MEDFYGRLAVRGATIDELLSDAFEVLPGSKADTDLAARRLAAWCRSAASGDWAQLERRLARDGLSIGQVLARLATVRPRATTALPGWVEDAAWIENALHDRTETFDVAIVDDAKPRAFERLLTSLVAEADQLLWGGLPPSVGAHFGPSARACLRFSLLDALSELQSLPLYERFVTTRDYGQFVTDMKDGGFRTLFENLPVLLRLTATLTRQWIDSSRELACRLDADLNSIRGGLLRSETACRVRAVDGDVSDPHNHGRTVQIITFEDGSRVVYKPKDLRLDAAWHAMVERFNNAGAPVDLRAVRTIARDGYGWCEFIEHTECADVRGFPRFFRRAGAWLAIFHCFTTTDMHHENMIAAGEFPVPLDLEMVLQPPQEQHRPRYPEAQALNIATDIVANSVMAVGLLPAYGRALDHSIFAIGGVKSNRLSLISPSWDHVNSDAMRPAKTKSPTTSTTNLPHVAGRYAKLGGHVDDFIRGFEEYARFLARRAAAIGRDEFFAGFGGLSTRRVVRPTRFYGMLLQRLRNHQTMDDGGVWSSQADFIARLADWDTDSDPLWSVQSAERAALLSLSVPYLVSPTDVQRAQARVAALDEREIAWQVEVIRQSTAIAQRSAEPASTPRADAKAPDTPWREGLLRLLAQERSLSRESLIAHAGKIARELSRHAIRRGPGAAWIGLDWMGDSEVSQLVTLGPDLYNGVSGIALFLAAHATVAGHEESRDLALAALAARRIELKGRSSARVARSLGIGGGTGLGSIVYALAVISELLGDPDLLADAHLAAELITDDLIAADRQLDVVDGSAGAILSLLRLYRQSGSESVLERAVACGYHLIAQPRTGPPGRQGWKGQGPALQPLNGMSHGAAGFACALAVLGAATGDDEFSSAAAKCIAFENSTYDAGRRNWPDLRFAEPNWPSQWCHGACGIGLARIAVMKHESRDSELLIRDVESALACTEQGWPGKNDTLCCGTLGNIEFCSEAGRALGRPGLQQMAARRLAAVLDTADSTGDFRWTSGSRNFNLGLFRGLAGVGYTVLRRVDQSLPNVLIWE